MEFGFKLEREEKIKQTIYTVGLIRNQQTFILAAFTKITVHVVQVSTYKILYECCRHFSILKEYFPIAAETEFMKISVHPIQKTATYLNYSLPADTCIAYDIKGYKQWICFDISELYIN